MLRVDMFRKVHKDMQEKFASLQVCRKLLDMSHDVERSSAGALLHYASHEQKGSVFN
jgi:hypothetical protein